MLSTETEARKFAAKHPGWECWQSLKGRQWHARLVGAVPPCMVHDDTPAGLSEQVEALQRRPAAR
jgi:hypothetical protein